MIATRLYIAALAFGTLVMGAPAHGADSPQFRGPNRDGIYTDTGLLKSWPQGGPKMLWSFEGLGKGYATVTSVGGKIFTTGMDDLTGTLFAFDLEGKLLWKREFGRSHPGTGYPGTRTTPTYSDGRLYILSSLGKAVCLNADSGEIHWEVDLLERFKGSQDDAQNLNLYFGISESPLVIGDKVIYTPGGADATLAALNKTTGETIWTTKGMEDKSAYCNPRLFDDGKRRQIITMVQKNMIGVDPDSGELLWKTPYPGTYDIHAVSPVFQGSNIYVSDGYKQGGTMFELAADGKSVTKRWKDEQLDVHHGGAVLVKGRVYGAASTKDWYCLDLKSGEVLAKIEKLGKGATVYADGMLYGYVESGEVLLVNPDPANFKPVSSFKIDKGTGQHWAHPAISNGILYIRHGDALMAFDIKDYES